ncbi:MAG: glycosyltransferase family 4 protein [Bacteroidota bacterium]|nr:glycosyltransferase family 4 protein [Bacteroidota bacterium]
MRIAIVTPEFVSEKSFDGGLANYTYKLAKWLKSKGNEVIVFLLSDTSGSFVFEGIDIEKIEFTDYAWRIKYYTKKLKLGFLFPEWLQYHLFFRQGSCLVFRALKNYNKKSKIDIIQYPHLNGYAYYSLKKIPFLVRLSSSTQQCNDMGGSGRSKTYMEIINHFEIASMKKASAVFGPSRAIASLTELQIDKKISILETPYIKPIGELNYNIYNEFLSGKKYVLFFGSIGLIKGVGTIAEIIHRLLSDNPDLYYVFVGKQLNNKINNIDAWDYLLHKAAEFKNRVIYIPSQKHQTLFPIIKHAQLITLPSRTDNFPNTCIESMANKKIVIGTKGNGFDQLITDGENGLIIDVDDHSALLNKIKFVLSLDSAVKDRMEQKALERIINLKPDIVLNQLMDLYKKTINEYNGS